MSNATNNSNNNLNSGGNSPDSFIEKHRGEAFWGENPLEIVTIKGKEDKSAVAKVALTVIEGIGRAFLAVVIAIPLGISRLWLKSAHGVWVIKANDTPSPTSPPVSPTPSLGLGGEDSSSDDDSLDLPQPPNTPPQVQRPSTPSSSTPDNPSTGVNGRGETETNAGNVNNIANPIIQPAPQEPTQMNPPMQQPGVDLGRTQREQDVLEALQEADGSFADGYCKFSGGYKLYAKGGYNIHGIHAHQKYDKGGELEVSSMSGEVPYIGAVKTLHLFKEKPAIGEMAVSHDRNIFLPSSITPEEYNESRKLVANAIIHGQNITAEQGHKIAQSLGGVVLAQKANMWTTAFLAQDSGAFPDSSKADQFKEVLYLNSSGLNFSGTEEAGCIPCDPNMADADIKAYYQKMAKGCIEASAKNDVDVLCYNMGAGTGCFGGQKGSLVRNFQKESIVQEFIEFKQANPQSNLKLFLSTLHAGEKTYIDQKAAESGYADSIYTSIGTDKDKAAAHFAEKGLKVAVTVASDPLVILGVHGSGLWVETNPNGSDEEKQASYCRFRLCYNSAWEAWNLVSSDNSMQKIVPAQFMVKPGVPSGDVPAQGASIASTESPSQSIDTTNTCPLAVVEDECTSIHSFVKDNGKGVLNPYRVQVDNELYRVYQARNDIFVIQEEKEFRNQTKEKKIGIKLDLTSCMIDGEDIDVQHLPLSYKTLLEAVKTEMESEQAQIDALRTGRKFDPEMVKILHELMQAGDRFTFIEENSGQVGQRSSQQRYVAWRSSHVGDNVIINFQPEGLYQESSQNEKIGLNLSSQGEVLSSVYEGRLDDIKAGEIAIPEQRRPLVELACKELAAKKTEVSLSTSPYNNLAAKELTITTHMKASLVACNELITTITATMNSDSAKNTIRVYAQGASQVGIDASGLTKDLFTQIFADMYNAKEISTEVLLGDASNGKLFFQKHESGITSVEKRFYQAVGSLLHLVYENNGVMSLGNAIDEKILSVIYYALTLTEENMTVTSIQKAMIRQYVESSALEFTEILDLLYSADGTKRTQKDVQVEYGRLDEDAQEKLITFAVNSTYAMENDLDEDDLTSEQLFMCFHSCFDQVAVSARFCTPVVSIVNGFKRSLRVKSSSSKKYLSDFVDANSGEVFLSSFLGRSSKEDVADRIVISSGDSLELQKKIDWVKEWILNSASKEDLAKFVRFVTGNFALSSDLSSQHSKINICGTSSSSGAMPESHTCFSRLDLPQTILKRKDGKDLSEKEQKEHLIGQIKEAIASTGYQMG